MEISRTLLRNLSIPYTFPSSDEIKKSWRLGFVKITAPKLRPRQQSLGKVHAHKKAGDEDNQNGS
jgi:hypothetical protein